MKDEKGHGSESAKYHGKETCKRYVELAAKAKTDIQIAAELGVTVRTLENWEKRYPAFAQARDEGRTKCEAKYVDIALAQATGRNQGSFQALRWIMMNKFGWRDKVENDVTLAGVKIEVEFVEPDSVQQP